MAWICVYEELPREGKMTRLARQCGCSKNEAMGILVSLWLYGINVADESGLMKHIAKEDLEDVVGFTLSKDLKASDVVAALIDAGWIEMVAGDYQLHSWGKWQEYFYKYQNKKERDRAAKRKQREGQTKTISEPKPVKKKEVEEDTSGFVEFWNAYPRKEDKASAYKKYKARLNDGFSPEELLKAATLYAKECEMENTPKVYIKLGKTFLSDSTPFMDVLKRHEGPSKPEIDNSDPFAAFREDNQ